MIAFGSNSGHFAACREAKVAATSAHLQWQACLLHDALLSGLQSQERRESIRQTWMRLTLQRHPNVDVRFVLGQPDVADGAGLGTGGLLGETALKQAHSLLLVCRGPCVARACLLAAVCYHCLLSLHHLSLYQLLLLGATSLGCFCECR